MKSAAFAILITFPAIMAAQTPDPATVNPSSDLTSDVAALSVASSSGDSAVWAPLTPAQKTKRRLLRLTEPVNLLGAAMGAGINQWRDVPHAWGQGGEGYADRFASSEGYIVAHNTVALTFDLAFHLDPRYRRMPEAGVKERIWNALSQSFLAYKDSGGRTVNVSEIAGNYGAGFISNTWQPSAHNSTSDALMRGTLGLLFHTGKNVAREFVPDLFHRGSSAAVSPVKH